MTPGIVITALICATLIVLCLINKKKEGGSK